MFRPLFKQFWNPNWFPKLLQNRSQILSFFLLLYFIFSQNTIFKQLKCSFETQIGPAILHKIQRRFTRNTKISPRGPSEASKNQTNAFMKPGKTPWFLTFLRPQTSHETLKRPKSNPRNTQGPPTPHAKTCQKKSKKYPPW